MKNITKRYVEFLQANKDLLNGIEYLNPVKLLHDLQEAQKYKKGYYKNEKGVYLYIKGIELSNCIDNLPRMGYNGEDRGIWVHYCIVETNNIHYTDIPINTFSYIYFNPNKPNEFMHPITKGEFDAKVQETINNLCSEYDQAIDVDYYLSLIKTYNELSEEYLKVLKNSSVIN